MWIFWWRQVKVSCFTSAKKQNNLIYIVKKKLKLTLKCQRANEKMELLLPHLNYLLWKLLYALTVSSLFCLVGIVFTVVISVTLTSTQTTVPDSAVKQCFNCCCFICFTLPNYICLLFSLHPPYISVLILLCSLCSCNVCICFGVSAA